LRKKKRRKKAVDAHLPPLNLAFFTSARKFFMRLLINKIFTLKYPRISFFKNPVCDITYLCDFESEAII
jgi:hypothetical protein